jgi:hypothetical protein
VEIHALTPYAHVADLDRSIAFYELLGLSVRNTHHADGRLVWAFLTGAADDPNASRARLMLALADEPVDPGRRPSCSTVGRPT